MSETTVKKKAAKYAKKIFDLACDFTENESADPIEVSRILDALDAARLYLVKVYDPDSIAKPYIPEEFG